MKRLLSLLLLPLYLHAQGLPLWVPHADGDALVGGWREGGQLSLFAPIYQFGNSMLFAQGGIGHFKDSITGTFGGGYRTQLTHDLGWGVNVFADYAYSERTNLNWIQGGLGGEVISSAFEFRANAYVPRLDVQTASTRRTFTVDLGVIQHLGQPRPVANITQFVTRHQEKARWGFDVEGGAGVPLLVGSVWGHLGYYRFQNHGLPTIQGPRARAEYRLPLPLAWGDAEMWIGGEYTKDQVNGSQASFKIHFQVPLFRQRRFGASPNMCVFKRLGDSVRRQNAIVLKRFFNRQITRRQVGLFFIRINGPNNAPGTQQLPTSLLTANANSLPGDFIFVLNLLPGFQPIPIGAQLGGGPYTLKNEQTLVSFGNSGVATLDFGQGVTHQVFDLDGAGRGGLTQNVAGQNAVIVSNNNTIQGTSIQAGVDAISATGQTNLIVTTTNVNGFTGRGIGLTNFAGAINLSGNAIDGLGIATTRGVQVVNTGAVTSAINIDGNDITRTGLGGIDLEIAGASGNMSAIINNNTVDSTGAGAPAAIRVATNVNTTGGNLAFRISSNRVTTSATQAILGNLGGAAGAPTTINGAVSSNTITTTGVTGAVQMNPAFTNTADTATLLINNNTLSGITGASIVANLTNTGTMNVTVTDNADSNPAVAAQTNVILVSSTGTACLTATGNRTNRGAGPPQNILAIRFILGTFQVTNQAALSTNNNGMTALATGTTNTTTNCPLPVTP